jgi:hypothetical protein
VVSIIGSCGFVDNIRATLARLAQHGVKVEEPRVSRTNSTIANATGPDGVRIELSELGPEPFRGRPSTVGDRGAILLPPQLAGGLKTRLYRGNAKPKQSRS